MNNQLEEAIGRLSELLIQARCDVKHAEAWIARINPLIHELSRSGLTHSVHLGQVICERPFCPEPRQEDSGRIVQAALLVPEGFGVCVWDTEEFGRLLSSEEGLEPEARTRFVPFEACDFVHKMLLLPHIEKMLEAVLGQAGAAGLDAPSKPGGHPGQSAPQTSS
jgi:hypothetical protein